MAVSGFNTPSWRPSSPAPGSSEDFSLPAFTITTDGILFDMDGTLIDSTAAIVKHWEGIGRDLNVDPKVILATSHGRRSIDVFREIAPEKANEEHIRQLEGKIPLQYGDDAHEIPGARYILDLLDREEKAKWTIVTSGTRPLVEGWLKVLKLAFPPTMVTADDVKIGKPNPEPYLLGKEKLGLSDSDNVLVMEDAPAGVRAGKAAGCKVLALATTHKTEQLWEAGADWIVNDLSSVRVKSVGKEKGVIQLEVKDTLRR